MTEGLPSRKAIPEVADALDLQEVLTEVVSEATGLLRAAAGDVILKDAEAGVLRVVAGAGFPSEMVGMEYGLEEGLAARAISTRRTISVRNYRQYRHRLPQLDSYNIRAALTSPLIARGEAIGVLAVEDTDPDTVFGPEDARLLAAFAEHAAVAIDNAGRFERESLLVRHLERANHKLSRSLTLQRRLVDCVLSGAGTDAVVAELAALLGCPVVLHDHLLRLVTGASPPGGGPWEELVLGATNREDPALRRFLDGLSARERPEILPRGITGLPVRLCIPVTSGRFDVHGYLILPEQPSLLDRTLVDVAATGVALEMLKQAARAEAEQLVRGDLVADLVTGSHGDEELTAARASRLGHDLSHPRDLILIRIDDHRRALARLGEADLVRIPDRLVELVRSEVRAAAPDSIVGGVAAGVVVLASQRSRHTGGYGGRPPKAIAEALRDRLAEAFPELSFSAAVGERCSEPAGYAPSFELARRSLDAMEKLGQQGIVVDVAELGLYRLLVAATPNEELDTYVRRALQPLLDQGPRGRELIETLRMYVDSGFNRRETSRRAYLHVNTVADRLKRIEHLLDVSLDEPDTLLELSVALRIAKLTDLV